MTITDSGTVLTTGRSIELPDAFPLMGFHNATAQTLTLKKKRPNQRNGGRRHARRDLARPDLMWRNFDAPESLRTR